MTCRDAIRHAFEQERRILTTAEVTQNIYQKHPEQPWSKGTISAELIGLSVNHSSSHHYPTARKHAFLFSLGNGRYRLWNRDEDGSWEVTPSGVRLVDESEDVQVVEESAESEENLFGVSLSLERDLENSLVNKLDQLEPGLYLYESEGFRGQQVDTGVVGRLDLLAVDSRQRLVVIELKVGQADDRVCGQILRYMGWVQRNIARGQQVRGIIIANGFNERVRYAAEAIPSVELQQYSITFNFKPVQ